MPVHDWTRVAAGVFHHFHLSWIDEIARALNAGVLPADYYAMGEQHAAGFEPDVLTLHATRPTGGNGEPRQEARPIRESAATGVQLTLPTAHLIAETEMEFYRRKQNRVVVRHVSSDRIVAVVEILSPGNKSTRHALDRFVSKAADFLDRGVHLLLLDLQPPGRHDPSGIHGAVWDFIDGQEYRPPEDKRLTLVAYESDLSVRAFVEPIAVGDLLPDMPVFLVPGGHVPVPLERTYQAAWEAVPRRWRTVIEGKTD
jgi:hypothetical protein